MVISKFPSQKNKGVEKNGDEAEERVLEAGAGAKGRNLDILLCHHAAYVILKVFSHFRMIFYLTLTGVCCLISTYM